MNSILTKVLVLPEPRSVKFVEEAIETDKIDSSSLVVKTLFSAISPGTEVAAYRGAPPLRDGPFYPRVNGYCSVGEVIALGSGVEKFSIGDKVLTLQSHRSHSVLNVGNRGSDNNAFQLANDFAFKIEPGTNLEHACVSYLYHLGYHSLMTGNVLAGHHVAVVGLGVLGYTTAQMSESMGASTYAISGHVSDLSKEFRNKIKLVGKKKTDIECIHEETHGHGVDVVINTSNEWSDHLLCLKIARKGGVIVNLGFPGRDQPIPDFNPLDSQYTYVKNLTIKAVSSLYSSDIEPHDIRFNLNRNMEYLLSSMRKSAIYPDTIITDKISPHEIGEQYERYLNRKKDMFTTVIDWTV